MKLISMTDFVLLQHAESSNQNEFEDNCYKYANFLKQPLKLEMFIGEDAIFIFQCEFTQWHDSDMENQKIEDLLTDDFIYVLNDNAIKRIFG